MLPQRTSVGAPERVGPYELIKPIGEGGMGVVYRARHIDGGRHVALKIVRVSEESLLASFRREVFALRCIDHPQVVKIVDDGVDDGRPWYAMQLLSGRSLADYIEELHRESVQEWQRLRARSTGAGMTAASGEFLSPPPDSLAPFIPPPVALGRVTHLKEILSLMRALCSPLAYVHGAGIVHRDLKPENILIRDDGLPVLLDFGLALHFSGGEHTRDVLDVAGRALGTPPYMAPEQIRGDLVDARADLYALGCMMYECLTGRIPFEGSPVTVLQKHLSHPAPLPSASVEGIPAELDELIERLLKKKPRERIGYAADVATVLKSLGATVPTVEAPAARPYLYRPSLAGRNEVVEELKPMLQANASRAGAMVFIGGESGVGKTRLAMELATWAARRGARVVVGRCLDARSDAGGLTLQAAPLHPLRPLLQAIADRCRTLGEEETERVLGDRGPLLWPYEPTLAHLPGQRERAAPPDLPAEAARYRLLEALSATLSCFAEREPSFLVVDDLQWADELSLLFLQHLDERFLENASLFIVGTFRNEERTEALDALLAATHVISAQLGMLARDAVSEMVGDMLALDQPPEALVEFLMHESEGNPFFIAEYLRAAIGERVLRRSATGVWTVGEAGESSDSLREALGLPGGLRDLVRRRYEQLEPEARDLVQLAAVLGREIDGEILLAAAAQNEVTGRSALEALRSRQILEEDDSGGLRFVHDKIREVVYAGIEGERLGDLHLRAARCLEQAAASRIDGGLMYQSLAHHFSLGGDHEKAVDYLERAGEQALASAASGEACRLFERALATVDAEGLTIDDFRRARWERRIGEARYNMGDLQQAKRHLLAALDRLQAVKRLAVPWLSDERVSALLSSASALASQLASLAGYTHPVSQRSETRARFREAALAAERLSQVHYFLNEQNRAFAASLLCAQLAEGLGPSPELARAYATLSVAMGFVPMAPLVTRYGQRAERVAADVGDRHAIAFVAFLRGLNAVGAGEQRDGQRYLEDAGRVAHETGDMRAWQEIQTVLIDSFIYSGDCPRAFQLVDGLFESAARTHNKQAMVWATGSKGIGLTFLGRSREALALYEQIAPLTELTGDTTSVLSESVKAMSYLMVGDWDKAIAVTEVVERLSGASPSGWHCCQGLHAAADVLVALWERNAVEGRDVAAVSERARRACKVLERAARIFGFARGGSLVVRGQVESLSGRSRAAERAFDQAIARAKAIGQPFDLGRAHLEMARHLRPGDPKREHHAREAERVYAGLAADAWVERCRALPPTW